MEHYFLVYLLCISVIFIAIILVFFRNKSIINYHDKYLSNKNKKLKYIPKKIFQLIADKSNIDSKFQKNIDYLKNLNPDWEYFLLDDNDIIVYITTNYGYKILDIYNKINPKYGACRADFFRYLLMYKEGGVYFDIKSACKYPLNQILLENDEYILSYWDTPTQSFNVGNLYGELQQWHIICRPGHPYLHAVINKVIENIQTYTVKVGVGKVGVLKVTGPIAYSNIIFPIINQYKHRLIELNEFIGLIYNNLQETHTNLFSKPHYSKINESIII